MPLITPIFSSYLTTFVATGGAPLAVGKQDAEENGGARRAGIIELCGEEKNTQTSTAELYL
jgi:hypothetical protein